jgi:hypothetical protein
MWRVGITVREGGGMESLNHFWDMTVGGSHISRF